MSVLTTPPSSGAKRRIPDSTRVKNFFDRTPSEVEDLLELASHAEPVDEPAEQTEGERVVDMIVHDHDAPALGEAVRVDPGRIGPLLLDVLEFEGRAPLRDPRDP